MPLALTRAILPESGQPISSRHINSLSSRISDIITSGLGDFTRRQTFFLGGVFRSIRNPDASGFLFPPEFEFFEVYQSIKPLDIQWPITGPGEPEGINVANPFGAYVFGNDGAGFDAEENTIGAVPTQIGSGAPTTPFEIWILRQAQVGAVDPQTGDIAAPMLLSARNYMRLIYSPRAPYMNSWGGNLPVPETGGDCAAADEFTPPPPDWLYLFTAVSSDVPTEGIHGAITTDENGLPVVTYPGSCPEVPEHVRIFYFPDFFEITQNGGAWVDILPRSEWFEGPYRGGGECRHAFGDQFSHILNEFLQEFRGTPDQVQAERDRTKPVNHAAFNNRQFLGQQYRLSPQRGHVDQDSVVAEYPRWVWRAAGPKFAAGGFGRIELTGQEFHDYLPGWSLVCAFSGAIGLLTAVTIEAVEEKADGTDAVLGQFTVDPAVDSGQVIWNLDRPVSPHRLGFRLMSTANFSDANGRLLVEATECYPYLAGAHDAAAVARLLTESLNQAPYGTGPATPDMVDRAKCYFKFSTLWNPDADGLAPDLDVINTNPLFDAARRFSGSLKVVTRQWLRYYAIEDGNSVLYFQRFYNGGTSGEIDLFEGLAAPHAAVRSGAIMPGRKYTVAVDRVTYGGHIWPVGRVVTGVSGFATYDGPGELRDIDGIYYSAPPVGYNNRWVMDVDLKGYQLSESSNWKPSAYTDYFGPSDRCLFALNGFYAAVPAAIKYNLVNGDLAPELPSAYRYSFGMNQVECDDTDVDCQTYRRNNYKSCQIYNPPAVVQSAESVLRDGVEMVKVTFAGRLQKCDEEGDFDDNVLGWDFSAVNSEPYRTVSNGIRAYLISNWTGNQCNPGGVVSGQAGNHAALSTIQFEDDKPFGSCYPHFFFSRLPRMVNEDDNDSPTPNDSALCADLAPEYSLYLRILCESFVDGETSQKYACASGVASWFAWTWENLCFAVNKAPWTLLAPKAKSGRLLDSDVRTDAPKGFGALPTMPSAVAVFRQFGEMANRLNQVAVMLPSKFQTRTLSGSATKLVNVVDPDGVPFGCSTGSGIHGVYYGSPLDAGITTTGDWADAPGTGSGTGAAIVLGACPEGDGGRWALESTRYDGEYRWVALDPDSQYAIPESWRDMVSSNGSLLVTKSTQIFNQGANPVYDGSGSHCCRGYQEPCAQWWVRGDTGALAFINPDVAPTVECVFVPAAGTIHAPAPPAGAFEAGSNSSPDGDTHCNSGTGASISIAPILSDGVIVTFPDKEYTGG